MSNHLERLPTRTSPLHHHRAHRTGSRVAQLFAQVVALWSFPAADFPAGVGGEVVVDGGVFLLAAEAEIVVGNGGGGVSAGGAAPGAVCGKLMICSRLF